MRIAAQQRRRRRGRCTASSSSQRARAVARCDAEAREMLVELRADGQHRIERGQRLLRDERDVAAEQRAAALRRASDEVVAVEPQAAAGDREPGGSSCAMARPTIDLPAPDSPTRPSTLPGCELERKSPDHRRRARPPSVARDGEISAPRGWSGAPRRSVSRTSSVRRRPSPSRLKPSTVTKIASDREQQVPRRLGRCIAARRRSSGPRPAGRRRRSCRRRTGSPRRSPRCPSPG